MRPSYSGYFVMDILIRGFDTYLCRCETGLFEFLGPHVVDQGSVCYEIDAHSEFRVCIRYQRFEIVSECWFPPRERDARYLSVMSDNPEDLF